MSDLSADPGFTLLGSTAPVDDAELGQLYAYPETDEPRVWVRANFIGSIDGGATVAGTSGGLAGPGDRSVFMLLRALADVVMVGAGTVRVENYGGARLSVAQRQDRRDRGQSEVPRLAIVTQSGQLDRDMRVFNDTELAPLVLTCSAAADDTRRRLAGHAEVLDCSGDDPARVDETVLLAALAQREQYRVLTEGGPTLLGSLIEHELLDELCLTMAPYLVGGLARRIATGPGELTTPMRCAHLLADESGYLYGRYVKAHAYRAYKVTGMTSYSRFARIAVVTAAAVLAGSAPLLAGCAPGLAADPRFATNSGAGPQGQPESTSDQAGPPAVEVPKNDLPWHDCTARVFGDAAAPATPGVRLDCASYDADVDPLGGGSGSISIGVVRARSVQTPGDAGPVVFTTGWDLPSSLQLPIWLARAGADVLKSHPIVAVDRRGIGMSSPVDCRDRSQRDEMWNQAQFAPGDDPVASLGTVTQEATTDCTDSISPGESSYDNTHAATDLERLRSIWDIPALSLIGIGNGAQIALAYAGSHPGKVARLALDSPIPLGVAAESAAEERVKGQEAAFEAFAAQCVAVSCALGPDPKGAVDAVLDAARSGHGPGGASVAAVTNAIVTALGYPTGDRVNTTNELAKALASANSGDANLLTNLINRAQGTTGSDGRFINSCADALNRPTPDRVRELVVAWGKEYPQFGMVGALDMAQCLSWPSSSTPELPKELKIDVLLLGVQNDPIVGEEGVAATAAAVINAGSASKRVMWQGIGHGAAVYSACTLPPLIGYLDSGKLPDTDVYCPA